MTRLTGLIVLTAMTALAAAQVSLPPAVSGQTSKVTFDKDVLPILQKNCQTCHRPGEVAPMSFMSYESTRPWAKAMKEAVASKKMPPWFADSLYGDFRNAPQLTDENIKTIVAWADAGAPEGEAKDMPSPIHWPEGWRIKPDVIVSLPQPYNVPAKGSGEIKTFNVPNPFTEDTWVDTIEIRPTAPSVVHHVMLQTPEDAPDPTFTWGGVSAAICLPPSGQEAFLESPVGIGLPTNNPQAPRVKPPKNFALLEAVYAPGNPVTDFRYNNSARLIKAGGNLRIEVHYTPNGTAVTDQTRIGFTLSKKPPQYRFITLAPKSLANTKKRIPAGAQNWETRGVLEFAQDAQLVWLMPHMHLRGKDMTFNLVNPNGRSETVLNARFNFNWQLGYELESPIRIRRGTQLVVVAHHDNSANNPFNPDPTKEVAWGNLTSEEMVLPWFGVLVDKAADPEKILAVRQSSCSIANNLLQTLPGAVSNPAGAPRLPIPKIGK